MEKQKALKTVIFLVGLAFLASLIFPQAAYACWRFGGGCFSRRSGYRSQPRSSRRSSPPRSSRRTPQFQGGIQAREVTVGNNNSFRATARPHYQGKPYRKERGSGSLDSVIESGSGSGAVKVTVTDYYRGDRRGELKSKVPPNIEGNSSTYQSVTYDSRTDTTQASVAYESQYVRSWAEENLQGYQKPAEPTPPKPEIAEATTEESKQELETLRRRVEKIGSDSPEAWANQERRYKERIKELEAELARQLGELQKRLDAFRPKPRDPQREWTRRIYFVRPEAIDALLAGKSPRDLEKKYIIGMMMRTRDIIINDWNGSPLTLKRWDGKQWQEAGRDLRQLFKGQGISPDQAVIAVATLERWDPEKEEWLETGFRPIQMQAFRLNDPDSFEGFKKLARKRAMALERLELKEQAKK